MLFNTNRTSTDAITFDDVYLVPQYSEIDTRESVDISTSLKHLSLSLPIIAANMDSVCEAKMALAMAEKGGLGIIHRYMSHERQLDDVRTVTMLNRGPVGAAIGIKNGIEEHAAALVEAGAGVLVVDVAHGHHKNVKETVKRLKDLNLQVEIVAGNVATADGAMFLFDAGADTVKVGVGPGAVCTTRTVTGHGIPQLQALFDIGRILHKFDGKMIADGGIRSSGDIVKALASGACAVMVGMLLAGTDEAPGEIIVQNEKKFKIYRGLASRDAQVDFYGNAPEAPEGITTTVPYKGSVYDVLKTLIGGIRSGLSYSGARNIEEFVKKAQLVKVTPAGAYEAYTL